MKKQSRLFLIALAPCLIIGLGTLGNGCADKHNNDAALYSAYMAALASSTATSTSTAATAISVVTVQAVTTSFATASH